MHPIALICTTILGLLLFGLGLGVSLTRRREKVGFGFPENPRSQLTKMARAHGNTAEFAPFLAVIFLYLGAHNPSATVLVLMVAATLCRVLIVVGLLTSPTLARPHPLRFVGALGTYVCGLGLSFFLLF